MENKLAILFTGLVVLIATFSCESESDPASLSEDEIEEVVTLTESVFSQSSLDVDDVSTSANESLNGRLGPDNGGFGFRDCITVESSDEEDFPFTITLTYEDECSSNDVTKSGTISVEITGPLGEIGTQRIVTYDNYTVNGYVFSGVETFTNTGEGTFTVLLESAGIVTPEGNTLTWAHQKERVQIEGENTDESGDDVFQTTGSSSGFLVGDELIYSQEIVAPLISRKDCFWIVQGTVESTIGESSYALDYGEGACDDLAIRTENGTSEEVTLDFRRRKFQDRN